MAILTPSSRARVGGERPAAPTPPGSRDLLGYVRAALQRPMASYTIVITAAGLLLALGMMMVLSASSVLAERVYGDAYYFVKRQVVFLVLGLPIAWAASRMTRGTLKAMAWVTLFASIGLLLLTYSPLGVNVNGNRNWIDLGIPFLRLQPSESAKLAIVLWGADILAEKHRRLDEPKHLILPYLPVTLLLVALVVFQGDLGTALVMVAMVLGVMWMVGAPKRIFALLLGVGVAAVGFLVVTSPNRVDRFVGFLNPGDDHLGINMQPVVGIRAIASGGWWGTGLGAGRQKWGYLSEAHTDYVFAVIAEELGLFGSLAVLALFLMLGYAGLRIAMRSDLPFFRHLATGITTWFMFQALVNLAVVLRLGPVMGVPLPLLSYGGAALLFNLIALGLLLAAARHEPAARALIERRKRRHGTPTVTAVVSSRS